MYWEQKDINEGAHTKLLEELKNPKLKGSPDNLAVYSSPGGSHVSVVFQSEEGDAFDGTVGCLFGGTALGSAG